MWGHYDYTVKLGVLLDQTVEGVGVVNDLKRPVPPVFVDVAERAREVRASRFAGNGFCGDRPLRRCLFSLAGITSAWLPRSGTDND